MTIYTVAMGKGGSGKTTTAAELVIALTRSGRRVLALELDRQGHLANRLGVGPTTPVSYVAADVLRGEATLEEAAIPAPTAPGADVVIGTTDLNALDMEDANPPTFLTQVLPTVTGWDAIVIDTSPTFGALTFGALVAADVVIAPVEVNGENHQQLLSLQALIEGAVSEARPGGQTIHAVVPNRYSWRQRLDREIHADLRQRFGDRVTPTIRRSVAAADSFLDLKAVSAAAPTSAVARDYEHAMEHLLRANPPR